MADEPKSPAAPAAASGAKREVAHAGGGKLVPIVLLVNSALLAGVLALLVLRPAAPKAAPAPAGEHAAAAEGGEHGKDPDRKDEKKEEAKAEGGHGEKPTGPAAGATVRLPDFIVHLRDADADRYARVTFEIEVKEERGKDALNARLPQIRDAFLAYLSDRTVEELRGSEAMAQLKEALARRLHDIAPGAPVKAVYVTDLVVQ